jgi:tetratricopeptide (TPR) repeat protein
VRAVLALACVLACGASPAAAQESEVIQMGPTPEPTYEYESARRVEREVHAAILAKNEPDLRDAHISRAVELGRRFVESSSESAEAHYWLAVSLGLETEYSGPFAKLTTGKACYEATARALELDPDHAGAHELLGRIHAGVMRLPWLVRKLGASLGMNDALGEASWESAEDHLRRAAELDAEAIAPRLELGKLMVELERPDDAPPWWDRALEIEPGNELDRAMLAEADSLLRVSPN